MAFCKYWIYIEIYPIVPSIWPVWLSSKIQTRLMRICQSWTNLKWSERTSWRIKNFRLSLYWERFETCLYILAERRRHCFPVQLRPDSWMCRMTECRCRCQLSLTPDPGWRRCRSTWVDLEHWHCWSKVGVLARRWQLKGPRVKGRKIP